MVKVYILTDFDYDYDYLWLYKYLDQNRVKKVNGYKNKKDQVLCVVSYLLLKYAFKTDFNIDIPTAGFKYQNDKPYLDNINFSISHTDKAVIVAISNNEIGVDIEDENRKIDSSIFQILSKNEKDIINFNHDKFIKLWTNKESYLKLKGLGVSLISKLNFNSFIDATNFEYEDIFISSGKLDGYIYSLASKETFDQNNIIKISINILLDYFI